MTQIERLTKALITRPNDPFLFYAIAMEHLKAGDVELAIEKFKAITTSHPDYVPTYLQVGLTMIENDQTENAKEFLTKGIEVANRMGDSHAAKEMAGALMQVE